MVQILLILVDVLFTRSVKYCYCKYCCEGTRCTMSLISHTVNCNQWTQYKCNNKKGVFNLIKGYFISQDDSVTLHCCRKWHCKMTAMLEENNWRAPLTLARHIGTHPTIGTHLKEEQADLLDGASTPRLKIGNLRDSAVGDQTVSSNGKWFCTSSTDSP